jgi:hypothetical protein
MPVDAAWAAVLAVEDHLGGYGSWVMMADAVKAFVVPMSRDGEYRMCVRVWSDMAELSILAHGSEHHVLSWSEEASRWRFFTNDTGEHSWEDEVMVEIDARESGATQVVVCVAGLLVSHWHEDAALPLIPLS